MNSSSNIRGQNQVNSRKAENGKKKNFNIIKKTNQIPSKKIKEKK